MYRMKTLLNRLSSHGVEQYPPANDIGGIYAETHRNSYHGKPGCLNDLGGDCVDRAP